MLKSAALIMAAAASASSSPALVSNSPWWEKITVTVTDDGKTQSCKYESSLRAVSSDGCSVSGASAMASGSGAKDQYTRITFERRFEPGATVPSEAGLHPGDKLLAHHVMALAIDATGKVQGCKVVASDGDMTPDYGCEEAQAERFEASASKAAPAPRQGFMTVLVYGHAEHLV